MSALPPQLVKMKQELLDTGTQETARAIVTEYLSFFGLETVQEDLWGMLVASLTNSEMEEEAWRRHDRIFFYEFTMLFMQAVSSLEQQEEKVSRKAAKKR